MTSVGLIRPAFRISRASRPQNSFASPQVIISTEFRGPFHRLGFFPMTDSYRFCGTSYFPDGEGPRDRRPPRQVLPAGAAADPRRKGFGNPAFPRPDVDEFAATASGEPSGPLRRNNWPGR